MDTQDRAERCETCRYWALREGGDLWGRCRRWPPRVVPRGPHQIVETQSPVVPKDDWCGEWQGMEPEEPAAVEGGQG